MNTKMVVAVAALAVAFAAPALAQTAQQQQQRRPQHSVNPSYDVYKNGEYLGSDPDPNIRAQMQRGNGTNGRW